MNEKAFSTFEKAFLAQLIGTGAQVLKLVFLFIPKFIVFILGIVVLPLLEILFFPFFGNCRILAWRIGCTAGVWIDLDGSGTTITFVQKNTVCVMTLDTGHSFLLI
jgi:hypothetical protein